MAQKRCLLKLPSLSYHEPISDAVATLEYIPLSIFSRNSPQGIELFSTVSFYEDPLGQTTPVVRQGFSFEAVSDLVLVVPGHLDRRYWLWEGDCLVLLQLQQRQFEGFPIQSRHAGFQGSLSWFCGHFESFFSRLRSYGLRMEVETSIGTVDTGNNEFRPSVNICSDDPGSTAQLLNEFLYLHRWSLCRCRSIFPLEIHGWKGIVWELE